MDLNSLGIGAGLISALVIAGALWRHVWSAIKYCRNMIVCQIEVHELSAEAMETYLLHSGRANRMGLRTFTGMKMFVRPKGHREAVAAESIGKEEKTYWFGWKPLRATRTSSSGDRKDGVSYIDRPIRLSFIRGLFSVERLVLDAIDFFNERDRNGDGCRYRLVYCSGSARKPISINQNGSFLPPEQADCVSVRHRKLLRWSLRDIGPQVSSMSAMDSLALSDDAERLVDELRDFIGSKEWFASHCVPWKQGLLLHGAPGTGKTALSRAIAEEFDLPVFCFDLGTFFNDEFKERWHIALSETPCIALFEDIDTVFNGRETIRGELGFECLLNCLDGIERSDGVITIITTNRIETLDAALGGAKGCTRPGRIDHIVEMKPLDYAGRRKLVERILSDWPHEWVGVMRVKLNGNPNGEETEGLTNATKIHLYLRKNGPCHTKKITESLGIPHGTVSATLSTHKHLFRSIDRSIYESV